MCQCRWSAKAGGVVEVSRDGCGCQCAGAEEGAEVEVEEGKGEESGDERKE